MLEPVMPLDFVEQREGSFYLIGSRVPLSTIVREFEDGEAPESIRSHYPTLSLQQVYGAIAFYLGNKEVALRDIATRRREEAAFASASPAPPEVRQRIEQMRRQAMSHRS